MAVVSKRINKILIFFVACLIGMFLVTWEVLQSRWVANEISLITTKYAERLLKVNVSFNNLEFEMYPPGANLKKVKIQGEKNNIKFSFMLDNIGIYFNPLDIFTTKFRIDEIRASGARINLENIISNKRSSKGSEDASSPLDIFDRLDEIPLNKLSLINTKLSIDSYLLNIRKLQLKNEIDTIEVNTEISHFNLENFINKQQIIDEISLSAKLNRSNLNLKNLELKSGLATIEITGEIKNYVSKNIAYNLHAESIFPIGELHEWLDFDKVGRLYSGISTIKSNITGQGKNFSIGNKVLLKNFDTDFIAGEEAWAEVLINPEAIIFKNAKIKDEKQSAKLLEDFVFFDMKNKRFVESPIIVRTKNLEISNFLRYLKDQTSFLQGSLSGDVRFELPSASKFFFKVKNGATIENLKIVAGEDLNIIDISDFKLNDGFYQLEDGIFSMKSTIESGKTNLTLDGLVGNGKVSFHIPLAYLELDKFNSIVGQKASGAGTFSMDLNLIEDKIVIKSKKDFKSFSIFGINLEKVKGDVSYLLGDNKIIAEKVQAVSGNTSLTGIVRLDYEKMAIEGNYQVRKLSFPELKKILGAHLDSLGLTQSPFQGTLDIQGQVDGGLELKNLALMGEVNGKNIYVLDENFEKFKFNYLMERERIYINNLEAIKGRGTIAADFSYGISDRSFGFDAKINEIFLQDLSIVTNFPTTLKGTLNGRIKGQLQENKTDLNAKLSLTKSSSVGKKLGNSYLDLKINEEELVSNFRIFEGKLLSNIYLNFDNQKRSKVDLKIKFDDIKDTLILISGVDLLNMEITGDIDYEASAIFDYKNKKIIDLILNTKQLNFKKGPINLKYKQKAPEIIVKDGLIKKWETYIRGENAYIISKGKGDLLGDYKSETQLKLDASIVEVFNNWINKANGTVRGKFIFGNKSDEIIYEAFLGSRDLSFSSPIMPTDVSKADVRLNFIDNKINIERFKAQLISGTLDVSGGIDLSRIIPEIDLKYKFKDAGFVILKKSNLTFSGEGDFVGKNFPYTLSGDFYIQKFALINELTDFGFTGQGYKSSEIDFLPRTSSLLKNQILNFNLNVVTREPMFVRNSIADVGFLGNVQVLGGEKDIRLSGKVGLAPRNNKVTFKNNEFNFSKGTIIFTPDQSYKNPILDFSASSKINNIQVTTQLIGPLKDFDFKLSSDQNLTQSDILSLIVFGYTKDLSNNLSDAERESMTRAGVGSLIFDSFKINETLKDEFGLQVNLGTEIEEEEGNYLSQRNADTTGRRVRSATTFEVKKKINDDTNLSVTGTVNSSSTQRRAVNLNYKVDQGVYLEGVYESTQTDESEVINNQNSLGADFIWKWSFK